ncbi:MAG TPA: hypothetical protein VIF62_32750, partial [Labilithrix sp.]
MTSRAPFLGASLLALLAATISFSHSSEAAPPFLGATTGGAAQPAPTDKLTIVADRDDDDADGKPDADQDYLPPQARADLVALDARFVGAKLEAVQGSGSARIVANGRPIAWGERVPQGAYVQGVAPGRVVAVARGQNDLQLAIDVHGIGMRDGAKNPVDMTREHASLERTPPTRVDLDDADVTVDDPDALRVVVSSPQGSSLGPISVESVGADGNTLDTLRDVRLGLVDCEGMTCKATAPIR